MRDGRFHSARLRRATAKVNRQAAAAPFAWTPVGSYSPR